MCVHERKKLQCKLCCLAQLHTLVVETVLVCGCLSLLSSRCVAQDDVVMASYVVSQEGKKWSRMWLPSQQRLGPLQVQHSQGEGECV